MATISNGFAYFWITAENQKRQKRKKENTHKKILNYFSQSIRVANAIKILCIQGKIKQQT